MMQEISNKIKNNSLYYDNHAKVFLIDDDDIGLKAAISIHRKAANLPSFGATRFWNYTNKQELVDESLRLSKAMSYKSAISGLPYGGAKGVIFAPNNSSLKTKTVLLNRYVEYVDKLEGEFITGTDVGLENEDIVRLKEKSPFVVGASVNPAFYTAFGIVFGIEACLQHVFSRITFEETSFAIQGLGKVGLELTALLYNRGAKTVIGTDTSSERINRASQVFKELKIVSPEEIHKQHVDVFCPCAINNSINDKTTGELACKIIAGASNNQLEKASYGNILMSKNIVYSPDYVINAGGLISVVDEYDNKKEDETRIINKISIIKKTISTVLTESRNTGFSTNLVADSIAKYKANHL